MMRDTIHVHHDPDGPLFDIDQAVEREAQIGRDPDKARQWMEAAEAKRQEYDLQHGRWSAWDDAYPNSFVSAFSEGDVRAKLAQHTAERPLEHQVMVRYVIGCRRGAPCETSTTGWSCSCGYDPDGTLTEQRALVDAHIEHQ